VASTPLKFPGVFLFLGILGGAMLHTASRAADPPERLRPFTPFSRLHWPAPFIWGTNTDVGALEPVRMQLPPDTLTLATVQSFIHTDNVYEAEEDRRESSGWVGLFGVSYVPYATPRWTPRVAFQQALVRFTKESAGDYDSQILSLLSSLRLSANQEWTWHGGFTLSRYSGRFGGGGEFYKYYSIDNSVTYRRALDARQSLQLFGAYWLSWRHTDPVEFSRIENALSLGLVYYPAPGLSIAPYVRPGLFLYTKDSSADTDRRD